MLQLIEEQMGRIERIDALLLVGGFAGSEYLRERVQVRLLIDLLFSCLLISLEHLSRNNVVPVFVSSLDPLTLTQRLFVVPPSTV